MACARDFSRLAVAPPSFEPVQKILGIIAFEKRFLQAFPSLSRTPVEVCESIDQSRIVEHDHVLQGVRFTRGYPGINEPREVELVEEFLGGDPAQQQVLRQILELL
jgi:3-deoxy-manno-octulosonate cytidylyltransferase (CMP-KDO synthetase)